MGSFLPVFLAECFNSCFCCLFDVVAVELGGSSNPLVAKLKIFLSFFFGCLPISIQTPDSELHRYTALVFWSCFTLHGVF